MTDAARPECANVHCDHPAEFYPTVCMMAQGYPRGAHPPFRADFILPLCRECRELTRPADFLDPESRAKIAGVLRDEFKVPPNFAGAWLEFGTVGDATWQEMLQPNGETLQ